MPEKECREVSGARKEGKEPMKGKGSELRRACWENGLIDTYESVVVPTIERKVAASGFGVTDKASHAQ